MTSSFLLSLLVFLYYWRIEIALYFSVVPLVAEGLNVVPTTFANIFVRIFVSLIKRISKSELLKNHNGRTQG